MKRISFRLFLLVFAVFAISASAQTNSFTYQGRLTDGPSTATGTYQMEFSLYGSLAGADQIGTTITQSVLVGGGIFTVTLNFPTGTPFAGGVDRWLAIAVRKPTDPPGFTPLTPRQQITSSPYSIQTLNAAQLGGLPAGSYVQTTDARLSDARTPTNHAASHINGTDQVGVSTPAAASIPKADGSGKLAVGWLPVGTGISTVAAGDDSRFTHPSAGNYVFAYDATTQTISLINTFQTATFSSNAAINGWIHSPGTAQFICLTSGTYLIDYTATASTTSLGNGSISLRAAQNGTEIPGSQVSADISNTSGPVPITLSKSVIATVVVGDVVHVQFAGSNTGVQLRSNNGTDTVRPSISMTITRLN